MALVQPVYDAFPTNDALINAIAIWAAANQPVPFIELYAMKGGWEGWAQVEIARLMTGWDNLGGGSSIREDPEVYNGAGRCADVVHYPFDNAHFRKNVIELKCHSMWQDLNNAATLAANLQNDIAKIDPANRALVQNVRWYVIGIGLLGNLTAGAVDHAKLSWYSHQVRWTQKDQHSPTIFWCTY